MKNVATILINDYDASLNLVKWLCYLLSYYYHSLNLDDSSFPQGHFNVIFSYWSLCIIFYSSFILSFFF